MSSFGNPPSEGNCYLNRIHSSLRVFQCRMKNIGWDNDRKHVLMSTFHEEILPQARSFQGYSYSSY